MNKLINFMNWLTDMDWGWWPLLKHRPPKHEYLDSRVLMKITPFFGTITGILFIIISNEFTDPRFVVMSMVLGWLTFFIFYRVTFCVAWNARARQLKNNDKAEYEKQ